MARTKNTSNKEPETRLPLARFPKTPKAKKNVTPKDKANNDQNVLTAVFGPTLQLKRAAEPSSSEPKKQKKTDKKSKRNKKSCPKKPSKNDTEKRVMPRPPALPAGQRYRPGEIARREIRFYQRCTASLIPKAPFTRLVRGIAEKEQADLRFTKDAIDALQEVAEIYLTGTLALANLCALHANRVQLYPKDLHLARLIRGEPLNP